MDGAARLRWDADDRGRHPIFAAGGEASTRRIRRGAIPTRCA
jgi:hypothetical protein